MKGGKHLVCNKVKKKRGRPASLAPRNVDLKIRLNKEEKIALMSYSEKHGLTQTQAIVKGVNLLIEMDK